MRFPWQKRKVEQPTDFPLKLNTDNLNWCRDARLLLIEGNGTLKWESRGRNEDWSQQYALTLRGTPLIVHNAPDCPTCAGLLATGYGLDKADAPELQQISDVINFLQPHWVPATWRSLAQTNIRAELPSGNVPTTRVLRRISRFSRSITLLVRMRVQCSLGKSQ